MSLFYEISAKITQRIFQFLKKSKNLIFLKKSAKMDIINNTDISQYLENFDNEVIQNISKIVPALAALEDALLNPNTVIL